MKKFLIYAGIVIILSLSGYYAFVSFVTYSDGFRAGKLVKITHKGVLLKTWEGELSQGVSDSQIFLFSVTNDEVVEKLKSMQGHYVRLEYKERFRTFPWWGDTNYFVTKVERTGEKDTLPESE